MYHTINTVSKARASGDYKTKRGADAKAERQNAAAEAAGIKARYKVHCPKDSK